MDGPQDPDDTSRRYHHRHFDGWPRFWGPTFSASIRGDGLSTSVRVQLTETNDLSLAEVQVLGQ